MPITLQGAVDDVMRLAKVGRDTLEFLAAVEALILIAATIIVNWDRLSTLTGVVSVMLYLSLLIVALLFAYIFGRLSAGLDCGSCRMRAEQERKT